MPVFTLGVDTFDTLTGILEIPIAQEQVWYWLKPDLLTGGLRECAQPSLIERLFWLFGLVSPFGANGCPAVVRFGEADNPNNSKAVKLVKEWQLFLADLLALSEYGRLLDDLTSDEHKDIARAYRALYGNNLALCNKHGYNGTPYRDYITPKDLTAIEVPTMPVTLGFCTESYQVQSIIVNSHGQRMVEIFRFDYWEGPPKYYGIEILNNPAVQRCTNQYSNGSVGKFPQLTKDVYTALITKAPIYYYENKMERYTGQRRPIGYKLEGI